MQHADNEPDLPLIAAYLQALHARLGERVASREQILAEVEDHLRQATAAGLAKGLSLEFAQRWAIDRFGQAEVVAAAFLRLHGLPSVFDSRGGLPAPAVAELQRATSVALAPCETWLAALGYWVPVSDTLRFGAILLRSWSPLPVGLEPVIIDRPERLAEWSSGLLPNLRAGSHLRVQLWEGEWRLWYDLAAEAATTRRPLLELAPVEARSLEARLRGRRHPGRSVRCVRLARTAP